MVALSFAGIVGAASSANADAPPKRPAVATAQLAEQSARVGRSGQPVRMSAVSSGGASYWFTVNWSSGDSRLTDYETWTFYMINGDVTNFFVEEERSANIHAGWLLTNFEPWITAGSSGSTLGNWDPAGQVNVSNGQTITFGLAYQGSGVSTTFQGSDQSYNPYAWATHFSSEWRGSKDSNSTVGNQYVTRWYGAQPWGMQMAACGRGSYWWGNCSDR